MSESELERRIEQARTRFDRLREDAERGGSFEQALNEALEELGQTLEDLSLAAEELSSTSEALAEAQHEAELHAQRYQNLFRFAPDAYVVTDESGVIREVNAMAEEKLGQARRYLIGKPIVTRVARKDSDLLLGCLAVLRERRLPVSDRRLRFAGKRAFDASVSAVPEELEEGLEIRWLLRDVSERLRLEAQVRAAATAAVVAEDRERRHLASDLHDDVNQLLTLAGMKLGTLLESRDGGERKAQLKEVAELVSCAHQRTESLTFQLSPPILHDLGFQAAAEWLGEEMKRSYGLHVRVVGELAEPLSEELRIALFRGLRELLINVARHADTNEARMDLSEDGGSASVAVTDAGSGFDEERIGTGFGLLSLRERLEGLGGHLEIDSHPGGGSQVRMRVPLERSGTG